MAGLINGEILDEPYEIRLPLRLELRACHTRPRRILRRRRQPLHAAGIPHARNIPERNRIVGKVHAMKSPCRLVLLAALIAAGVWLWTILFPTSEEIVRKRLAKVAAEASFNFR